MKIHKQETSGIITYKIHRTKESFNTCTLYDVDVTSDHLPTELIGFESRTSKEQVQLHGQFTESVQTLMNLLMPFIVSGAIQNHSRQHIALKCQQWRNTRLNCGFHQGQA